MTTGELHEEEIESRFEATFAVALVIAELGGGLALTLGLGTPFAALAIVSAMIVAIATAHWSKGFWNGNGGFEFNLLIIAAAAALAATGTLATNILLPSLPEMAASLQVTSAAVTSLRGLR